MEASDKEIYLRIEKPKEDNRFITDPKAVQEELKKIFEDEKARTEQNQLFDENRANEVLTYQKKIVEAKTLDDLTQVKTLVLNRISFLGNRNFNDDPEAAQTLKELIDLLQYVDAKIKERESKETTEKKYLDFTCYKNLDPIIDDLIEIKIKELTNIKLDKDFPDNGFDRIHQVIQLIEKDIVDLKFDEEQRVLYLNGLMKAIIEKDLTLYHQGIYEYLPVDITSEILEWADKYLIAWELKMSMIDDTNTEKEAETHSKKIDNQFPEKFTDEGWQLFMYLDENYTQDNNTPKAKYSWIFHFLKYYQLISCKKETYRQFIVERYTMTYSRVQDTHYKYDNVIQPLLERLKKNFSNNIGV